MGNEIGNWVPQWARILTDEEEGTSQYPHVWECESPPNLCPVEVICSCILAGASILLEPSCNVCLFPLAKESCVLRRSGKKKVRCDPKDECEESLKNENPFPAFLVSDTVHLHDEKCKQAREGTRKGRRWKKKTDPVRLLNTENNADEIELYLQFSLWRG